jgi:MFS family permease
MSASELIAPRRSPFAVRDFRLLWIGEAVSTLGDQFAMIALPWLALVLTGSALALGAVLALMAVPRAVLMIVGGAYVDRLSPRRVMLASNAVRLVAVGALGVIVLAGTVEMWMLYAFALVFGVADAFFYPAQSAIVPELVSGEQLQQANGIVQGTAQVTYLVGPAAAGVAIAAFSGAAASPGLDGVGWALIIDAATFVASLATLLFIAARAPHEVSEGSVVKQIAEGISFVWSSPSIRVMMGLSMAANLLIVGPFDVGLPVLAYSRLPEGAAAYGLILSAFGGGSLLGTAGATLLPPLPKAHFGSLMLGLFSLSGICLATMAFVNSTVVALAIAVAAGAILGYSNITYFTWIQRRIPRNLMGRVMSLLMFSSVALVPISMAVSGALVQISLNSVLLAGGLGMAALALIGLLSASVRRMGMEPTVADDESEPADQSQPAESAATEPAAAG